MKKQETLILLSHQINSETPSYGNRDTVRVCNNSSIQYGDSSNTSSWVFTNNHIGTHIDAPFHFDNKGKKISDINISDWYFNCVFLVDIHCTRSKIINENDLKHFNIPLKCELILIRTGY